MAIIKGEERDTVFFGHEFISFGTVRKVGNDIYFRNKPYFPFEGEVLIGGNLHHIPKERRKMLRVGKQPRLARDVDIVWCDLRLNPYLYQVHPEDEAELRTLRAENQSLKVQVSKLIRIISAMKNQDLMTYEAKKLIENANEIKGFNGRSNGGGFLGGEDYGGFGGGGRYN